MLQVSLLGPLLSLIEGPVFSIIDKLIPDPALKAKLKAQIEAKTIAHQDEITKAQRDILINEFSHGSLLTRSWRPLLMYMIILFLLVYGLVLPIVDLFMTQPVVFTPRWQEIPDGLWNLLGLGVGGYVGGRSLEKVAIAMTGKKHNIPIFEKTGLTSSWKRRNNLT